LAEASSLSSSSGSRVCGIIVAASGPHSSDTVAVTGTDLGIALAWAAICRLDQDKGLDLNQDLSFFFFSWPFLTKTGCAIFYLVRKLDRVPPPVFFMKAIAFALVQDPDLEAQAALETDRLLVNSHILPRQPHAACLLVQFVKKCLNLPQQICLLTLLQIVTEVQQGEVSPEVFPAMLAADLVTLSHMLVHCTCILVVAKEWHSPLPVEPVAKLELWSQAICKEQGYKLI